MAKTIIADANPYQVRVALLEDGELAEIQVETKGKERLVGNIYKGRVANVLPGMQAAFVDVGLDKNAFLYAGDILCDQSDFLFGEDAEDPAKRKLAVPNISELVKPNQEIMVQVIKQPGGSKGARVTTHITLPGRLAVLMPTMAHVGVSRRIKSESRREELKELATRLKPENMGAILRTIAQSASAKEIEDEFAFLLRLWKKVQEKSDLISAPRLIHTEEALLFRTARDMLTDEVDEFIIDDKDSYEKVRAVVNIVSPALLDKVKYYEDHENIFDRYKIEEKVNKALNRKVWLKNGCYLVIDEAEALTAIDVNTGKYIGKDNLQETILNANIEAAHEIAKQLRLRDISGIIVIDFIDMESEESKQRVVDELTAALKDDRMKSNVLGMTELGLVQMTRKKTCRRLSALTQTVCPHCGGTGRILSFESMAMRLRREIIRQVKPEDDGVYLVEVNHKLASFIIAKSGENRHLLPAYKKARFFIRPNCDLHPEKISIRRISDHSELFGATAFS